MDMNESKPPVGITPYKNWIEIRAIEIFAAIIRYEKEGINIPNEWIGELQSHIVAMRTWVVVCDWIAYSYDEIDTYAFKKQLFSKP